MRQSLSVLIGCLLLCGTSNAATILNGSFEANSYPTWPGYSNQPGNGGIANWTEGSPSGEGLQPTTTTPGCCGPAPFGPGAPGVLASPDGGNWAFMQQPTTLSQNITGLSPGTTYTISYYDSHRNGDGGPGDTLTANVGGVDYLTTVPSNTVWTARSFNFTATAASELLTFTHGNLTADQSVALDGVSIATVPVPEPASLVLLGLGAIGLCVTARRRRQA